MRCRKEGSSTVEAAFVISLILFLMTAFLLMMFWLHDRAVLYETALTETAVLERMLSEPVSEQGKLQEELLFSGDLLNLTSSGREIDSAAAEKRFLAEAEERTFLLNPEEASLTVGKETVTLSYSGTFRVPVGGIAGKLFSELVRVSGEVSLERTMDHGEFVRLCRSITQKKGEDQ